MLLDKCLFTEFQDYAKRPGDTLPLDSFDHLFPRLVFIMLTQYEQYTGGGDSDLEGTWETQFHMHLYGTITPIELVRCSVSHPLSRDFDCAKWATFLEQWDADNEGRDLEVGHGEAPEDTEPNFDYEDQLRSLTLHRHARLITSEEFPLESLARSIKGGWLILPWRENEEEETILFAPRLDIRYLEEGPLLNESLQGCVWLCQEQHSECEKNHTVAEVDCRLGALLPLLETVCLFPCLMSQSQK
jgi:hypothetical protein